MDIILIVHCFHCRVLKTTVISNIKMYTWLTSSERFSFIEIKLLITEWIFINRSAEFRFSVDHPNGNSMNWKIDKNVLLNEQPLFIGNDKSLCWSL